jgi:ABC-type antimicrobial peptide transport system permease subunit
MAFDGVVVARTGGSDRGVIVVGCADLARVTDLACPLPQRDPDGERGEQYLRLEALFDLPYPDPTAADSVFRPAEFIEPNENSALLPIQTLFIPTDGSSAAMERIRTLAAATLPISRSKVRADLESGSPVSVTSLGTVLPYTMIFILLVAACSLTVSAVSGILERRRPFALLRASGMRLGELRAVVLLETGIPLGFTVLVAVGLATLQSLAAVPLKDWILPSTEFIIGLGIGVPVAFAVCLIALPFMNAATSLDSVRYE